MILKHFGIRRSFTFTNFGDGLLEVMKEMLLKSHNLNLKKYKNVGHEH